MPTSPACIVHQTHIRSWDSLGAGPWHWEHQGELSHPNRLWDLPSMRLHLITLNDTYCLATHLSISLPPPFFFWLAPPKSFLAPSPTRFSSRYGPAWELLCRVGDSIPWLFFLTKQDFSDFFWLSNYQPGSYFYLLSQQSMPSWVNLCLRTIKIVFLSFSLCGCTGQLSDYFDMLSRSGNQSDNGFRSICAHSHWKHTSYALVKMLSSTGVHGIFKI